MRVYFNMDSIKLQSPIRGFVWTENVSQLFGVNKLRYSRDFGIPGHNGIDIVVRDSNLGYGAEVLSAHGGLVVGISYDKTKSKGMGIILQKRLDNGIIIQTLYWHLSEVNVAFGQSVDPGTVIGKIGNTGYVFPEPSEQCPKCGSHLHFALSIYLNGVSLFTDYGAFADPLPFMFKEGEKLPIRFNSDLFFGCFGDSVSWLQTILRLEGFAEDYVPVGIFGPKTLRDVKRLQIKHGINPTFGYVGPKTRKYLNEKYAFIS